MSEITDLQVLRACALSQLPFARWAAEILADSSGFPLGVCQEAIKDAGARGLVSWGFNGRHGRPTAQGFELLEKNSCTLQLPTECEAGSQS